MNGHDQALADALAAIPGMENSRLAAQLSDGPTNASYLLEHNGSQYVLRLDKPGAAKLGLDRHGEQQVCEVVAGAGIAPEPLFFDPDAGIYLRRFTPGRSWAPGDLDSTKNLQRLAALLRTLHSLPPAGSRFEPLAAARRYAEQLGDPQSLELGRQCGAFAKQIGEFSAAPSLCHNDLVCQNVVDGAQLMLIDWEFAGRGDPFFDLAVVVRHHGLKADRAGLFLDAWLERPAGEEEKRHLDLQCSFYGCLLELWERMKK